MSKSKKINVLPEDLINKIAAGEVIDRPASVVKELVENALDAGATEITVIIGEGGKSLIQVVDNGSGMDESDLLLAFQRHATSKISDYADLTRIQTLGFRGEALASIASVARVEAKSVPQGSTSGHLLRIEGGVMQQVQAHAGNPGTSVAVKNLFFNTPARRKFLRATNTEYRQILSVLNRFFLAYPELSFTLVKDGEAVQELKPQSLEERIGAVLGSRVRKNLVPVENEGYLRISGFVGNQDAARSSRGDQYFYFNRRYFTHKNLNYAVFSAYGDIIPRGTYPFFLLFLEMEPEQADVNVHPTKMEVKFSNEQLVFASVRGAVKRALSTAHVIPTFSPQTAPPSRPETTTQADWYRPAVQPQGELSLRGPELPPQPPSPGPSLGSGDAAAPPLVTPQATPPPLPGGDKSIYEPTNVWQVHRKYILSEIKTGLILIDQHVAHERILYEQALESFEKRKPASQQLLFPLTVELSAEDFELLLEMIPFLERIGFIIKAFGKNTVVLEGVPSGIRLTGEEKCLIDMLDEFKRGKKENLDIRDNVAKSFACRSAIKAGEPLTREAMNALIDQLFSTREPYFCPHGRPVIINLSLEEIDRRFKRS